MSAKNIRIEVMRTIEDKVNGFIDQYLIPIQDIWQPTDFLPDSQSEGFLDAVKQIQEELLKRLYQRMNHG